MAELKFLNIGILSWITFLPLISVLFISVIPIRRSKEIRRIAITSAFIQLLLSIFLWIKFNPAASGFSTLNSLQFIEKWNWFSIPNGNLTVEYFLAIDGLSLPMIVLTSLLAFICISFTFRTEKSLKPYYLLFLFLDTSLIGSFASMDFFLFFIFSTAAIIPIYFLTGIFGGDNRVRVSSEFLIQAFAGSVLVLLTMLTLFYSFRDLVTGLHSFSIVSLSDFKNILNNTFLSGYLTLFRLIAFVVLFAGFACKLPIFPFHSRVISVLEETPAPMSGFISGTFFSLGLYSLLRILLPIFPDASVYFAYVLSITGLISIFYGAICAIAQRDIKRAVSYYSISACGTILIGIGSITSQGISGAVLHIFNIGILSGVLFLIAQIIYNKTNTLKIDELGNLSKLMPRLFILGTIVFLAAAGLPALNNFVSIWYILSGAINVPDIRIISIISGIGMLAISVFFIRMFIKIFFGNQNDNLKPLNDISIKECIVILPAVLFIIIIGIYPAIITNIIYSASTGLAEYISTASVLMRTGW